MIELENDRMIELRDANPFTHSKISHSKLKKYDRDIRYKNH